MRILVTRPLEESRLTAQCLHDMGFGTHIAPMFDIVLCASQAPVGNTTRALLFTSKSGVKAFCETHAQRDLPVWCVGDETASCARENGFAAVRSADGDSRDLGRMVAEEYDPGRGTLLRIAGSDTPDTLDTLLREKGFDLERRTLYQIRPIERLDDETAGLLRAGALDAAMFFSPMTARVFADCAAKAGLAQACRALTAWCISDETARALGSLPFCRRIAAPRPTRAALFSLLPINPQPQQAAP